MKALRQLTDSMFYIMAALAEPRHGYAVMGLIEETTKGAFVIGPASLYTILKKLLDQGLIVLHDESDSRRKVYALTEMGRTVLIEEIERRTAMIQLAEKGLQRGNL